MIVRLLVLVLMFAKRFCDHEAKNANPVSVRADLWNQFLKEPLLEMSGPENLRSLAVRIFKRSAYHCAARCV